MARLARPFGRLYPDGFGADLAARVEDVWRFGGAVAPVELSWTPPVRTLGVLVRRGSFRSPAARYLPAASARGVVEQWCPSEAAPVCLCLAATGEEGFTARRPLARWLATQGVSALLLENPYYGVRRPAGQRGAALCTVADQFAMNLATVEEAAALLATFHDEGYDVGVTGYSQGGVMAAFAAALSDFSVGAVPRGAAVSAAAVFTVHALAEGMRWDVLAAEAGGLAAARERFCAALAPVRVDRYPPPRDPTRAILVASRWDGFIPTSEVEALHGHWPGSELRWIDGGHFSGLALHLRAHWLAVRDAMRRPSALTA